MPVPATLILDDGAPVNIMYWCRPGERTVHLVPNAFTRAYGEICASHGVRGKFSVLPMPCGLGRLDRGLNYVPDGHLQGFIEATRRYIAPNFDITPELLTHHLAWNLERNSARHLCEDAWVARAKVPELTDYLSLAFQILDKVGLPANGVTSPWMTGEDNERVYAEAIGRAMWRVHRKRFAWYFLHFSLKGAARKPWVAWRDKRRGLSVASIAAGTHDPFWSTQNKRSRRAARAEALRGVDGLLSPNAKRGRVRELFDSGGPIVLITHWQALFSHGTAAGLWGMDRFFARINRAFGTDIEWAACSDLCRRAVN